VIASWKHDARTSFAHWPSSMSDNERPESHAVAELDLLVRHLADELAAFRRRALTAESKLKEVEGQEGGAVALDLSSRVTTLERENERLQNRLDEATADGHFAGARARGRELPRRFDSQGPRERRCGRIEPSRGVGGPSGHRRIV